MSILLAIVKTIMLIAFALAVFMGLAFALGVDPVAAKNTAASCGGVAPSCLFMIL